MYEYIFWAHVTERSTYEYISLVFGLQGLDAQVKEKLYKSVKDALADHSAYLAAEAKQAKEVTTCVLASMHACIHTHTYVK